MAEQGTAGLLLKSARVCSLDGNVVAQEAQQVALLDEDPFLEMAFREEAADTSPDRHILKGPGGSVGGDHQRHIHPLWSTPRVTFAADNVTVLSDHTCTSCHSPRDAANAAPAQAGPCRRQRRGR